VKNIIAELSYNLLQKGPDPGNILEQCAGNIVPLPKIFRAVVGDPDPTLPVFPNQRLEREINGDGGRRNHQRRPTLKGLPKMITCVGGIFKPAFSASPLWSMRQNIAIPWACSKDSTA
jgi:hypothetical protein